MRVMGTDIMKHPVYANNRNQYIAAIPEFDG